MSKEKVLVVDDGSMGQRAMRVVNTAIAMAGGRLPRRERSTLNRGRKNFGPGTAKNYNDRVCANGWTHHSFPNGFGV